MMMNKVSIIFYVFLSGFFYSQKPNEKTLADIDRISLQNPDSALILINKIEAKLTDNNLKSKLLISKGNAFSLKHLSSESLNSGFEAYNIANKSRDSLMMINSLCFIGNQYYIMKMNGKALNYLTRAERLIDLSASDDSVDYINANIFFVKGLIYKDKLDPVFALEYFDKAIDNYKKVDPKKSSYNLLITQIQKAYSLGDLNKTDEAQKILNETLISAGKEKLNEIENYAKIALANIATKSGNYEKSNDILLQVEKKLDQKENSLMFLEIEEAITNNFFLTKDLQNYSLYSLKYERSLLENEKKETKSLSDLSTVNSNFNEEETRENSKNLLIAVVFVITLFSVIFSILSKKVLILRKKVYL